MTQPAPRHPAAACPTSSPRPEAPAGGPVIPLPARPPRGSELIPLGTRTRWGTVVMVGVIEGERYYWLEERSGRGRCATVSQSMMPASLVAAA